MELFIYLLPIVLSVLVLVWISQIVKNTKKNADYSFIQSLIMLERAKTDKLVCSKETTNKFSSNFIKIKKANSFTNKIIAERSKFSVEELEAIEEGKVDPLNIDILLFAKSLKVPVSNLFE